MNSVHSNVPLLEVSAKSASIGDPASVVELISKAVSDVTRGTFGENLRAVVLTGSLSRNEGSIRCNSENIWRVHGDAEFLILLRNESPLPIDWDVERNGLEIEALLLSQGISCSISLGYCHEDFFRSMTPHMFAYETRATGIVVSGEFDALNLIPEFAASEIPREDAWRTLTNRMIEVAEAMAAQLPPQSQQVSDAIAYRTMKLTLDTATSVLLFEGRYAPTYSQRATNFSQLAATSECISGSQISFRDFADAVAICTEWKLSGKVPPAFATWDWVRSTCERALEVWIWELQKLSGDNSPQSVEHAIKRFMQRQSASDRARGWLYVIRAEGWLRSAGRWPRWFVMALRATPRYWTYEATGHLFSRIGEYLAIARSQPTVAPSAEYLCSDLPMWPSGTRADAQNWRDFARAIAFNYHSYLEGTRA